MKNSFLLLFILITASSLSGIENEYVNKDVLFSFRYPENYRFYENIVNYPPNTGSYVIDVYVRKIDDFKPNNPYGPVNIKKSILNLYKSLNSGEINNEIFTGVKPEVIQIDKINAFTFFKFTRGYADDVIFSRTMIFFNNGYYIGISLYADSFKKKIIRKMPQYFVDANSDYPGWKFDREFNGSIEENPVFVNFIRALENKNGSLEAQEWYESFNKIVKSIRFTEIKEYKTAVKFYKPAIDAAQFFESPGLNGKLIRSLARSEKLELVETGKADAIEGKNGFWISVKTEDGEKGWAFDGHLEEIK